MEIRIAVSLALSLTLCGCASTMSLKEQVEDAKLFFTNPTETHKQMVSDMVLENSLRELPK